ncbi:MAG: hypothetical protein Q4A18_07515 [Rikenellaceae bacterium]|nr:hypothetical protein [Rikenellaceae bacterium]
MTNIIFSKNADSATIESLHIYRLEQEKNHPKRQIARGAERKERDNRPYDLPMPIYAPSTTPYNCRKALFANDSTDTEKRNTQGMVQKRAQQKSF